MKNVHQILSQEEKFYGNTNPIELIKKYSSPLYVYNEKILKKRCGEMKRLSTYKNFVINYSAKANTNLELLKIIKDEGLNIDVVSPGELYLTLKAGFEPEQILFTGNNIAEDDMKFAVDAGITISIDSLSQLEIYGKQNPGGEVALRFNPGIGAGHHKKVMTAGKDTKFGIDKAFIDQIKRVTGKHKLKIIGINQHIGSLFMRSDAYLKACKKLLKIAANFNNLKFIDFGGGFGIPYHKNNNESRLDLDNMGKKLDKIINSWIKKNKKELIFKIEPGRYICAECGILLGTVHSIKQNYKIKYIGTDIGFNVLMRPAMYDSYHDVEIYRDNGKNSEKTEKVTIVGNICETGDIIAKDRILPEIYEKDIIGILDAGAYCYSMCSNYNSRLRPAEILIKENGEHMLIRKKEVFADLMRGFVI